MIGKFLVRSTFSAISYTLRKKENEKEPEVLFYNKCFGSPTELRKQFEDVANVNKRLKKPSLHIMLSATPEEKISNEKFQEMASMVAKEFEFENCQYFVVRHFSEKDHIHICVNRQSLDPTRSSVVSDSKGYERIAKLCRSVEQILDLQKVKSPNKFLPPEERMKSTDTRKNNIRIAVKEALNESQNMFQFIEFLKERGIKAEVGRGIKLSDDKITIKGSELNYSLQTITNVIKSNILKSMEPIEQRTKQLNISL